MIKLKRILILILKIIFVWPYVIPLIENFIPYSRKEIALMLFGILYPLAISFALTLPVWFLGDTNQIAPSQIQIISVSILVAAIVVYVSSRYLELPIVLAAVPFALVCATMISFYAAVFSKVGVRCGDRWPVYDAETAYYLSITTFTTLGYGDCKVALSKFNLFASTEALWGIFLLGLLIATLSQTKR